jgi:type VI secretion system secreted protein VgrG
MNLTDSLNNILDVTGTLNHYRLDIPSCSSPLDVEEFSGTEGMSRMYRYDIVFTSTDRHLEAARFLCKPASLTMGVRLAEMFPEQKSVHGVITDFRRISASADQTLYRITLKPFLSLLDRQFRSHRFFVNTSVPDVVGQVLQEHGLHGWEYEFSLKQSYPKREQINQYQESDLAFIQRLLAEVGIFYFFTLHENARTEVVHFADAQRSLSFGKTLPVNSPSGMSDSGAESVWGLNVDHRVVEANVTARDYNHREAQSVLQSAPADMTRGEGEGITYGEVYHYKLRHLARGEKIDPQAETANFYARLDHERFLANQTRITGVSNDANLAVAQVLTVTDSLPPTLPAPLHNPVLITGLRFDASRKAALRVSLQAVPYSETVCWRPALLPRPKVTGTMTARVTSAKANDIYAWQDASGLYRVKFDADRDGKAQGQESMPVRLARPYGGDVYGFHFPLIQGTEVAIAFHEGDPDRPYIAHALHDSRHVDHVTEKNSTRNVIRTPANNKLRMEDKRGEQHIKLGTEYGGKTQLNLGHNVDAGRALRGEGAELRTDDWVSIRGGKGILLSADEQPGAQGEMLDMKAAILQLKQALSLAESLSAAADSAKATPSETGSQSRLNTALEELQEAGILAYAPQGVGIVSPESVRVASGEQSVGIVSGKNTDISAAKSFTVAAKETVSLFAQGDGMQIFAGNGGLDIQAQGDAMNIQALKDVTVVSNTGKITVNAGQELLMTSGGAYIRMSGGNIELGCPGNILLKAANVQKIGAANINVPAKELPMGFGGSYVLVDDKDIPFGRTMYSITTSEGAVFSGETDEKGNTLPVFTAFPSDMKIEILSSDRK